MSLFEASYHQKAPSTNDNLPRASKVEEVDKFIEQRQEVMQILEDNLSQAQNRMK